jgi:hypothetical protein
MGKRERERERKGVKEAFIPPQNRKESLQL